MYGNVWDGNPTWNEIPVDASEIYPWDKGSTYIQEPPFFSGMTAEPAPPADIRGARVLVRCGDSVTTDHISPAGTIAFDSPAGSWLRKRGIERRDFNSYGSRRGNDRIMLRGTFANIRFRNQLAGGAEGGFTVHYPSGEQTTIFEAAERYREEGTPLVILAGREYGTGSSRDWAAKGTLLLGVKAVIAESFERIHRSNLVGMGVLPLEFPDGENAESLGLTGDEVLDIEGVSNGLGPGARVTVTATRNGESRSFEARCRLDSAVEVDYYRNGGILQTVMRDLAREEEPATA